MKSLTKTSWVNLLRLVYLGIIFACLPVQAQPVEGQAYLALGDSYTIGQGVAKEQRWPKQLAGLLQTHGVKLSPINIVARTGWTSADLLRQLRQQPPHTQYQLVSLQIGVNNQFRGQPISRYEQEFADLLKLAIGYTGGDPARVIVLAIPDYGVTPFGARYGAKRIERQLQRYNLINRQLSATAGVSYIDIYPVSKQASTDRSLIAKDGLHPSAKMYALWAQLCVEPLLSLLLVP